MPRINRLPEHIANLIAAGEVVERPGSVAKELVENAIDAGATRITVEIRSGGTLYLRVTDDGGGIAPEDVPVAFERHATSKLLTEEDLAAIATLGFRGEALAAVAAVARVDMMTRTRLSPEGTQISIEGGEVRALSETGCPVGTTVIIRDLFFNVPARAKFLKKDATEAAYVESAIVGAALARPDIAFTFIKDGREALFTQGDGSLLSAIHATCGRDIAAGLVGLAGTQGHISVEGFVSPPSMSRANRGMQYFFVNGRPVRSRTLGSALDQAYKGRLMGGRHPACFLNLRLHVGSVDINVHPAKLEVKFMNEKEAFSAVYHAVQTSLAGFDAGLVGGEAPASAPRPAPRPAQDNVTGYQQALRLERTGAAITMGESYGDSSQRAASGASIAYATRHDATRHDATRRSGITVEPPAAPIERPTPEYLVPNLKPEPVAEPEPIPISEPAPEPEAAPTTLDFRIVGEAFKTYLLAQEGENLWLIDKHAAHERMIYNDLTAQIGQMPAQMLLSPVPVTLTRPEKAVCLEHGGAFAEAGFEIEDFGGPALLVRQVPIYLDESDIAFAITDMAQRLLDERPRGNAVLEALLSSMACKRAIKAGQYTDDREREAFVRRVLEDPSVRQCPHGRPTLVSLTRSAVEKLFGRIV